MYAEPGIAECLQNKIAAVFLLGFCSLSLSLSLSLSVSLSLSLSHTHTHTHTHERTHRTFTHTKGGVDLPAARVPI